MCKDCIPQYFMAIKENNTKKNSNESGTNDSTPPLIKMTEAKYC